MAEKIVSPGVFTNEVDLSALPAGIAAIGAAVIGPTQRGPANIPTFVTSYSDFVSKFGSVFTSGSGTQESTYKYLTNYMVQEYMKYADTCLVTRVMAGDYAYAYSNVISAGTTTTGNTYASGSVVLSAAAVDGQEYRIVNGVTTYRFVASGDPIPSDNGAGNLYFFSTGSNAAATVTNLVAEINAITSFPVSASANSTTFILSGSAAGTAYNGIIFSTSSATDATTFSNQFTLAGGTDTTGTASPSFKLTVLSAGALDNSGQTSAATNGQGLASDVTTGGLLVSGSENNLRWEVANVSNTKGTFTLLIRRGDDIENRKIILEQYNNLTLDPASPNYIAKKVGDVAYTLRDSGTDQPYFQVSGSYPNRSKYVRVEVFKNTLNWFDANGSRRLADFTGSLPQAVSGTFAYGADGDVDHPKAFNENIFRMVGDEDQTQGFNLASGSRRTPYTDAIKLLKNQDDYDFNLLVIPGLTNDNNQASAILTQAQLMCESRGDAFLVTDPVVYGSSISSVVSQADNRNSNYLAMYWPWVLVADGDLGRNVWVPASTVVPSVYAFNDRVAAPWFAPAGLNRGGIESAVRTERKLNQANRDTLYDANVNPITSFPNQGVVVYGQKTMQKKASALDRVNVRRLLIAAKKFVASTSKYLLFENNTAVTRNRFLSIVNPYFDSVQQRQGLYAFKVVMDDKLNTPEVIDRNELRGAIYLQPAKTAEFIIIDFNILPTGAAFPE